MVQPMPTFAYRARDPQGREQQGQLEAASRVEAVSRLRQGDLGVTYLVATVARVLRPDVAPGGWRYLLGLVSAADLRDFFDQLARLLHAGVGLYEALEELPARVSSRLRPGWQAACCGRVRRRGSSPPCPGCWPSSTSRTTAPGWRCYLRASRAAYSCLCWS